MPKGKTKKGKLPPTKPIKIAALIITAIQNLRETKGSTSGKIVDYITLGSNLPQGRIKPQVKAALKRGVEYGVLKRFRGHYFLPMDNELDRADRIATRFAKLPMSVGSRTTVKYKTTSSNRFSKKKLVKLQPAANFARRPFSNLQKNLRKSRSVPLSLTSTTTGKSYHREKQSSLESDID